MSFSDPFGLKADTLDFADDAARNAFNDCRVNYECATTYAAADAHPAHIKVSVAKPGQKLPHNIEGGYTRVVYDAAGNISAGEIILQPQDFSTTAAREGIPITMLTVTVHELGHVVGTQQRIDKYGPGNTCSEKCAMQGFENPARARAALPLRVHNPAIHLP